MSKTYIPADYAPLLNLYDTQKAIALLKRVFEDTLCGNLHLRRVSAPLFVEASSGLNDNLSGKERPVSFDVPAAQREAQVVHSLAKWKRLALHNYHFPVGEGLVTDMNAIRREEIPDNLHSIYVDQWDWEKVIAPRNRNLDYLKATVQGIINAMVDTQKTLQSVYPQLCVLPQISPEVSFVTSQELEDKYPGFSDKEREDAWVKEHPTTFIIGIGGKLKSGKPHDGRAPDYDDWTLNGDLMFWDETLEQAVELSSMGIRVDEAAMRRQCAALGCENRLELPFHQGVLNGTLPLSMGGGIGQSRLCMLLLGKAHIGEVQVSLWPKEMREECARKNIALL